MKITFEDGFIFEGTQAEYEELIAYAKRKEVEKQTRETVVAEALKPKLKVGDFVKITRKFPHYDNDKAYEIVADSNGDLCIIDEDGDYNSVVIYAGDYEILSEEEVKWAKIGRKVNEFRKGDIILVTHSDGDVVYGKITENTDGIQTYAVADFGVPYRECTESISSITLLSTVESLFTTQN